jgi:replicative DNA helicase
MKKLVDLLHNYTDMTTSGKRPTRWDAGKVFDNIVLSPGRVVLVGGPPAVSKTAFVLALVVEALARDPALVAYLTNVEMDALELVHRIVARRSGIDVGALRNNAVLPKHAARLKAAVDSLAPLGDRLVFGEAPHEFGRMIDDVEACGARLVAIDYIQRLSADARLIPHSGERERLEGLMAACRTLANRDRCAIVVSAVGRARDSKGQVRYSSNLTQANLRGSSELEFAADDVIILHPSSDDDRNDDTRAIVAKHEKCRNGQTTDKTLLFHRPTQTFREAVVTAGGVAGPSLDDWLRQTDITPDPGGGRL